MLVLAGRPHLGIVAGHNIGAEPIALATASAGAFRIMVWLPVLSQREKRARAQVHLLPFEVEDFLPRQKGRS